MVTSCQAEGPHQPKKYKFSERQFGKLETRSFKVAWFDFWPWIDYQEVSESITCYYCSHASSQKLVSLVRDMSNGEKALLSQVIKLVCLLLVMPATNAISEWSFSTMHRVKTYLPSTMSQKRLNSAMVLHIHKDLTDTLDLKSVCKEFISDYRKYKFSVL